MLVDWIIRHYGYPGELEGSATTTFVNRDAYVSLITRGSLLTFVFVLVFVLLLRQGRVHPAVSCILDIFNRLVKFILVSPCIVWGTARG